MDIKGKITIFPRKVEIEGKVKTFFNGTISTKVSEGENETRLNKSVDVVFSSKNFPEEKLNQLEESKCYSLRIDAGFLGVKEKVINGNKVRELYIVVTDGTLEGSKIVEKKPPLPKNDDLPF